MTHIRDKGVCNELTVVMLIMMVKGTIEIHDLVVNYLNFIKGIIIHPLTV